MSPNIVRPVGLLEKCSTARHSLGLYRRVIVTGRYSYDDQNLDQGQQQQQLGDAIHDAVARVIPRHPALCCGIVGEEGATPSFVALERIDLRRVVRVERYSADEEGEESREEYLCRVLEQEHDKLWTNLDTEPAWRLRVMHLPPQDDTTIETLRRGSMDVIFIFHHALSDGLSGGAFHVSLLAELQALPSPLSSHLKTTPIEIVPIPKPLTLIDPVERLVHFPLSYLFTAKQVLNAFFPTWISGKRNTQWAGSKYQLASLDAYRSRMRLISIPAPQVAKLVSLSRSHGVTITGLITGLAVAAISQILPPSAESLSLVGMTAYTLRKLTGTPMTEMVNQSAGFETSYPSSLLAPLRDIELCPEMEKEIVWSIAQHFHAGLKAEMAKAPRDNLVGLLPLVSDLHGFYWGKLGQKRDHSFEMSNLGVIGVGNLKTEEKRGRDWKIDNLVFTQGAQVCGSALALNCATVDGGPLNVTLTWQDGVVESEFADELARRLGKGLRGLRWGGC